MNAIEDVKNGHATRGATLFVTLEPCSTHGRTPPCTQAIVDAGIGRVDRRGDGSEPEPRRSCVSKTRRKGVAVEHGLLADRATEMNAVFNHWITTGLPWVTVKAAMTLDGKIATASGESKWITGPLARREGMKLRHVADAIVVGVNTILADDPSLTVRDVRRPKPEWRGPELRRIVLDPRARIPSMPDAQR